MRVGGGWATVCGAVAAVLLLAAAPSEAQQQAPAAGEVSPNSYALLLRDTEERLGRAIERAQGSMGRTQAGAMPPGQQQLMDATQGAWQSMQSGAPEAMRSAAPYGEAERTFRRAVEAMRVGNTPPDAALAAAREAHAALGQLRQAAAQQAGGAAGSAPSPATSSQGTMQEPPRR